MKKKNYTELNKIAIQNKDFNAILKINSRFINTIANKRAYGCDHLFQEYRQIIMIALYKAFSAYVINDKVNFIQYATGVIKNDLVTYFHRYSEMIKIPKNVRDLINDNKIEKIVVVDYEAEINDDYGHVKLIDTIIPTEIKQLDLSSITDAIDELRLHKEIWADIVYLHHGLNDKKPLTFTEIAPKFGLSRQGCHQQYQAGIKWLKKNEKLKIKFKQDNE